MFLIIVLTLFAAACRKTIAISEKLSLQTWKLLSHVQFLLFLGCLWGLQQSGPVRPPLVQPQAAPPPSIVVPNTPDLGMYLMSSEDFRFGHLAEIKAPVITSISPTPVSASRSQNCTINGSNFVSGSTVVIGFAAHEYSHASFVIRNTGSSPWYLGSSGPFSTAPGPFHLHFGLNQSDFPNFKRIVDPRPTIVVVSSNQASNDPGLLYWVQLLGAIILPIGIISTNVLGWVLYRKSKVEDAAARAKQRAELEKLKLEIRKLKFDIASSSRR